MDCHNPLADTRVEQPNRSERWSEWVMLERKRLSVLEQQVQDMEIAEVTQEDFIYICSELLRQKAYLGLIERGIADP
jgi:hypothetical protein